MSLRREFEDSVRNVNNRCVDLLGLNTTAIEVDDDHFILVDEIEMAFDPHRWRAILGMIKDLSGPIDRPESDRPEDEAEEEII
jgi:hypothetical protein